MKKCIILLLSIFFFNGLNAQEKYIKIFNEQTGKHIVIKENRRVRIKNSDGTRISGKLTILDDETILIKHHRIKLNEIEKIKRNPLIISALTSAVFYYCGTILLIASIAFAIVLEPTWLLGTIPSTALFYGAKKPLNFFKGYKNPEWQYGIVKPIHD